jgi:peptide chain release factor 3
MQPIEKEISRRRTFAIISHPDAGKTTLTEKLLLYAGAIELAGAVRGRKARRHATSDWMALEQERGISITSAALEFEIDGRRMSLIDTPGHKDFSEDTYRALIAADSVVMVIDAANGVEGQTRKLFEVCRRHRLPILTFVNKFDRPARDPLELLDDIESTLGISAAPVNWPVGNAEHFRGVYDIQRQHLLLYEREMQGQYRAPVDVSDLDDPHARELIGENTYAHFRESLDVIRAAGTAFDIDAYLSGRQTPVFFGSAMTNFGLEPFLKALVELALGELALAEPLPVRALLASALERPALAGSVPALAPSVGQGRLARPELPERVSHPSAGSVWLHRPRTVTWAIGEAPDTGVLEPIAANSARTGVSIRRLTVVGTISVAN